MMDLMNPDPLGIGLRQRAREHKDQFEQGGRENAAMHGQLVGFGGLGPIQDPAWQGLFQAMDEAGADRVAGASPAAGQRYAGLPESQAGLYQPTFNPQFQQSARAPMAQHPAVGGLQAASSFKRTR